MKAHRTSTRRINAIRRQSDLPYQRRELLLSPGEAAFFRALNSAVAGRYLVTFKVRAADLLTCPESAWEKGYGYMVCRHHVDFVLCHPRTTKIAAAIELDDRSHAKPSRMRRDEFLDHAFAAAGIPLIRFRAASRYSCQDIAREIRRGVNC